jgi:phosphotransferase system  glucose/maltose/N-acetylglucosamine-specific IIC component
MCGSTVNAAGEERKKRSKALDFLLLLVASLCVAATIPAAFFVAKKHHINPGWMFGAFAAVLFFPVVGWGYRSKFRSAAFLAFFLSWTLVHAAVFVLVLDYLGLFYYPPIVVVELWIGYMIAIWQFGPRPDRGIR